MSQPLDKGKKVTLIVACVAIAVSGLLITDQATDGALKGTFFKPEPPKAPEVDAAAQAQYERRQQEIKKSVENGTTTISGS